MIIKKLLAKTRAKKVGYDLHVGLPFPNCRSHLYGYGIIIIITLV